MRTAIAALTLLLSVNVAADFGISSRRKILTPLPVCINSGVRGYRGCFLATSESQHQPLAQAFVLRIGSGTVCSWVIHWFSSRA